MIPLKRECKAKYYIRKNAKAPEYHAFDGAPVAPRSIRLSYVALCSILSTLLTTE
jgi:hypothetical protein